MEAHQASSSSSTPPQPPLASSGTTSDALLSPHAVIVSRLPTGPLTTHEIRQFMTACGIVEDVRLLPEAPATNTSPAAPSALVYFRDAGSVPYAELLTGSVFKGSFIRIRRASDATTDDQTPHVETEPGAFESGSVSPRWHTCSTASPQVRGYTPRPRHGATMRTRLLSEASVALRERCTVLWNSAGERVRNTLHGASLRGADPVNAEAPEWMEAEESVVREEDSEMMTPL